MSDTELCAPPVLLGQGVTLRPARSDDVDVRLALGQEPIETLKSYGISTGKMAAFTRESAERWVSSLMRHSHAWVIEAPTLIGSIRLDRIDLVDRRAAIAIGIVTQEHLGRGIGTAALRRVLQYAFDDLALHRISLRVLASNARAIRAYQKCGFQIEGRERESALIEGAWQDDLIMGLLAHELRLDN